MRACAAAGRGAAVAHLERDEEAHRVERAVAAVDEVADEHLGGVHTRQSVSACAIAVAPLVPWQADLAGYATRGLSLSLG